MCVYFDEMSLKYLFLCFFFFISERLEQFVVFFHYFGPTLESNYFSWIQWISDYVQI